MRLLSFQDLQARGITFTRQWIHALIRDGKFPQPVKIGSRRNAWMEEEIDQWIKNCADRRDRNAA